MGIEASVISAKLSLRAGGIKLDPADRTLWAEDQARALRNAAKSASNLPIDWENVAEEIESLRKAKARELASRIETILLHLIKLEALPSEASKADGTRPSKSSEAESSSF